MSLGSRGSPSPLEVSCRRKGAASSEANQAKRDLIDFGRALFVKEWMIPFDGEDETPSEEEAVAEFNSYLRKWKR